MADLPKDMFKANRRKPLTAKQKMEMFLEHGGVCCICGHKIDGVREAWDEHILPLVDGGTNDMANRGPAHERCAREKTGGEATSRAKARSAGMKHWGAKEHKYPPIAGSRRSRYKRRMDGTVVMRDD